MNFTEEARKIYADINFGTEMFAAALQSAYERGEQSGREKERERCAEQCDYVIANIDVSYRRQRFDTTHMRSSFRDGARIAKEHILGDLSKWVPQDEDKP